MNNLQMTPEFHPASPSGLDSDPSLTSADVRALNDDADAIKEDVRRKYDQIARRGERAGCGCGCSSDVNMIGDAYEGVEGYVPEADLGLGCGIPTDLAGLRAGETVLDLGSGAGLDAFVARSIVGEEGRVIGVDMTDAMLNRARDNAERLGYANVEFRKGEIEALPVERDTVDVVISNCVLNLVPDKPRAFAEMYRVLKPDGRFCVSDIVVRGALPDSIRRSAELYAGCVAGAVAEDEYLNGLREAGFERVEVMRSRDIDVPENVLLDAATPEELAAFRQNGGAIMSVTVAGLKPAAS